MSAYTYSPFPDAEAVVGTILRAAGHRAYSSIPKKSPTYPLITYQRIGGTPVTRHTLDAADIQLDVWGNTKSEAYDLAAQARAAVHSAAESTIALTGTSDAWITGVDDVTGPQWLPDSSNAPVNRYTLTLRVYLHSQ